MSLALVIAVAIVLCFGLVIFGAPYVPTKEKQIKVALDLLDLKPNQVLYDLGMGDGRVAIAAAQRKLRVVGYELNPILTIIAKIRTWKYRHFVRVYWRSYWSANLSTADGVFIFSSGPFMKRLGFKLDKEAKELKLVSFAFKIPGRKIVKEKDGVFLYHY